MTNDFSLKTLDVLSPNKLSRTRTGFKDTSIAKTLTKNSEKTAHSRHNHSNVLIETSLPEILPELIQLNQFETLGILITGFGAMNNNYLNLLISHGLEELAMYF